MITRIFVPSPQCFDQFTGQVTRDRAKQAALEIGLAAQAYRREQGEFPADSSDFIPKFFDHWPVDPFSQTGQPMHYRRENANSAIAWSVGPNGSDENGEVIFTEQNTAKDVGIVLNSR